MNYNEIDSVDIRKCRQLAHVIVSTIQTQGKAEQAMAIGMLVSAMSELGVDVPRLLSSSDNALNHAKKVHPNETMALLMYIDNCIVGNGYP